MNKNIIKKTNKNRINTLTGARFIAIMLIVINHFEFLGQYGSIGYIYQKYLHSASIGVDFFFMLSGFGMMLSSINKSSKGTRRFSLKYLFTFARRHVKKIYPIYISMLILGIPYYILVSYYEYGKGILQAILQAIIYFVMDITLLQSLTGITKLSHSLNGVCWFLSSLFCIYLISPIIMKRLKRLIKNEKQAILAIGVSILCSFIIAIIFKIIEKYTIFDDLCYGSPYRRVFYVIVGMLIAQIYNFRNVSVLKMDYSVVENGRMENVCIIITIIYILYRNSLFEIINSYIYILDMLIVASDLYLLALGKGFFSKFLESKYMIYLGNISMYIFVTHWLIRMYVDFVFCRMHMNGIVIALCEVIIILFLTFVVILIIKQFEVVIKNHNS